MEKRERLTKRAGWHKDIDLKDELGYSYIYQRLAEWENAIDDGEIVRLPCKVGDTVYRITQSYRSTEKVTTYIIKEIIIDKKGVSYLTVALKGAQSITCKVKLETVFITREEAEKKLKELKENK